MRKLSKMYNPQVSSIHTFFSIIFSLTPVSRHWDKRRSDLSLTARLVYLPPAAAFAQSWSFGSKKAVNGTNEA